MDYLRFSLIAFNSLAFLALGVLTLRHRRAETYTWARRLWSIIALGCGAVVVGSVQRLALQAVELGWLSESVRDLVTGDIQLVQSLVVLALIVWAFVTLRSLSDARSASDRLTDSLLDRVRHIDPAALRLTDREGEVLAFIGDGVTTDADLAASLHISASTVQTHIKSLLRKTGLHRRTDLMAVAALVQDAARHTGR